MKYVCDYAAGAMKKAEGLPRRRHSPGTKMGDVPIRFRLPRMYANKDSKFLLRTDKRYATRPFVILLQLRQKPRKE